MLLQTVVFLHVALLVSTKGIGAPSALTINCFHQSYYTCLLSKITIPAEASTYEIFSPEPERVTHVRIDHSNTFRVVTNDFCKTFPILNQFNGNDAGIEVLTEGAFSNCLLLSYIIITGNSIKVLPPSLFRNSPILVDVVFAGNKIERVASDLLETNTKVTGLVLVDNEIGSFPAQAISSCQQLRHLELTQNNIVDLEVDSIIEKNKNMSGIFFSDNLIPCEKVPKLLETLHGAKIDTDNAPPSPLKARNVTMGEVGNIVCRKTEASMK